MKTSVELHIVLDSEGVSCVKIMGPPDTHNEHHELYLKIVDLVKEFDKIVQKRMKEVESNDGQH